MGKIGAFVSRSWGVEESIIDSTPIITYVTGGELRIENHGGVEELGENELLLGCKIRISGEKLRVEWIERDMVVIKGEIATITFERN